MRNLMALLLILPLLLLPALGSAEEDPLQEEVLSTPGETLEQSLAKAQAVAAQSQMNVTVSAVGFDIPPGSEADKYLQATAQAGNGGYFTANDAGQRAAALGAAAAGLSSPGTVAGDTVVLYKPTEGEIVGPSLEITGKTTPGVLVVVYTIAYPFLTDEEPQLVPGTRQRAKDTGEFAFRIATPRVSFGEREAQVRYAVRAYVLHADGTKGPETVVNCYSPKP
jgi:hypothetical protein